MGHSAAACGAMEGDELVSGLMAAVNGGNMATAKSPFDRIFSRVSAETVTTLVADLGW